MKNIWIEEFKVRTWDVDKSVRLHLAAVFNYFQEVAGNHAESLGVGKEKLKSTGHAWVLSRMTAVIDRRSDWGEIVYAHTWPRGTDRLFAVRDYELLDSNNTIVARGRSGWIVLDTVKMRPVRPNFLTDTMPANSEKSALEEGLESLKTHANLINSGSRTASYSDIDYNGHVNNARYVQWIQDILPAEELEKANTFRMDINYLSEVVPGTNVDFFTAFLQENGGKSFYAIEGRHQETGQPAFRAEIRIG